MRRPRQLPRAEPFADQLDAPIRIQSPRHTDELPKLLQALGIISRPSRRP